MRTSNKRTMAEWLRDPVDPKIKAEEKRRLDELERKDKEEQERKDKKKKDDDLMLTLICCF